MSKEGYYYRGVEDKDGYFYRMEKVPESIKQKDEHKQHFDTPELCKTFCDMSNQLTHGIKEAETMICLNNSYERILNGESS